MPDAPREERRLGAITPVDLGYRGLDEYVAAFLIRSSEGPVLVECGPAKCLPRLESGLARHGLQLGDIRHVFLTHIHLDHAGASGQCAEAGATIHVHPRGARHLVDPSRLMASATRVFGDALDRDLGSLEPSPGERVHPVADGESVVVGDLRFTAIETTGHARHHHAWMLESDGRRDLFSGDAAGMRLPGSGFPTLPLVAPDLDPVAWRASIERMLALSPDAVWLTHFGRLDDQRTFMRKTAERVRTETEFVMSLLANGDLDEAGRIERYRAWHADLAEGLGIDRGLLDRHCDEHHFRANLQGVAHMLEGGNHPSWGADEAGTV